MALPDVLKIDYSSWSALTITLASLATSATLITGRESAAVDNTSNLYDDYLVSGKVTTGTSPTASKTIEIWVYGEWTADSTYPDALDGTDSGAAFTSRDILFSSMALGAMIPTDNTSNQTYPFKPFSVASLFGGVVPPKWGVFVTHDTGVNLNATGSNHSVVAQGIHWQIADS